MPRVLAAVLLLGARSLQVAAAEAPALGVVDFKVSCTAPAQAGFNRAVALLHNMTYPQARQAFRDVSAADPRCGMAHWGVAMTLFQPLWPTRPSLAEKRQGLDEVRRALAAPAISERERLFMAAAEAFFRDPDAADYPARVRSWAAAQEKVHLAFPQDREASAFFALALLATAPAGPQAVEYSARAAKLLLRLYEENPRHPGAMHYLVHADDVSGREREDLEIVSQYEKVAPDNPHALHMPTHIYTRLGDWDGVVRGNLRAAEAALRHPAGEEGELVWDEFPHAIEYLVYAYLQQGADDKAAAQIARLVGTPHLEPSAKTAFHLASVRARYALERRAWSEAAALAPREPAVLDWDLFPWPEAVSWFARGMGAAKSGDAAEARRAVARLEALEAVASKAGEAVFARQIRILRLSLSATVAQAAGDAAGAVALARQAVELETSTAKPPVTPGPTLPAAELLGDLLFEQGQPVPALEAFEQSLRSYPRRFASLLGAARAARAAGRHAEAGRFYRELLEVGGGGVRTAPLTEARGFSP